MHKYLVSYLHMQGSQIAYGNTYVTRPRPIDSEREVDEVSTFLRNDLRMGRLTVMGIFKLGR